MLFPPCGIFHAPASPWAVAISNKTKQSRHSVPGTRPTIRRLARCRGRRRLWSRRPAPAVWQETAEQQHSLFHVKQPSGIKSAGVSPPPPERREKPVGQEPPQHPPHARWVGYGAGNGYETAPVRLHPTAQKGKASTGGYPYASRAMPPHPSQQQKSGRKAPGGQPEKRPGHPVMAIEPGTAIPRRLHARGIQPPAVKNGRTRNAGGCSPIITPKPPDRIPFSRPPSP